MTGSDVDLRRLIVATGLTAYVGFFVFMFVLDWIRPPHRINSVSAILIRKGMTEEQVINILGVPHGDHRTNVPEHEIGRDYYDSGREQFVKVWLADHDQFCIVFESGTRKVSSVRHDKIRNK